MLYKGQTTGKNKKIWENGVGYFYDIAAWFPKNMVIVNKDAWNKLDADTQKLLMSEAAIAEKKRLGFIYKRK